MAGGAFSVNASDSAAVARYIRDQKSHHSKLTFEDEFMALLRKHQVEFDPKSRFLLMPPLLGLQFRA
jgi:putative transposase